MKRGTMNALGLSMERVLSLLLMAGLVVAGCATSGDVEDMRQRREQAKAKMRTELQQEQTLASSMEKESQARRAEADKLAQALGGAAASRPLAKAPAASLKVGAAGMSLATALATSGCQQPIAAHSPNPAVPAALFINSTTSCNNVTVSTTDTTAFTAQQPLIPVVIGAGGTLTFQDPGAGSAMTLYASSFLIQNAGTVQAGTAASPIAGQITIVMAGNASAALAPQASGATPIVSISNNAANSRDITVMDGGVLALYGGKGLSAPPDGTSNNPARSPAFINTLYGTKSWTYLAAPAGPVKYNDAENVSAPVPSTAPDSTLTLANAVDWQVGDWISVATTSFSSHQTEMVQICGVASIPNPETSIPGVPSQVSQLSLCHKLKHYHYGGLAPTPGFFPAHTTQSVVTGGNPITVSFQAKSFYDDHTRNFGIDERAEVALLSRNIKLTSLAGSTSDPTLFTGGHVVGMVSSSAAAPPILQLVGVEIEKFGQALVGRYPVHLHMLPNGSGVLVQDVSVHHSYNKCYVPHRTPNAKFYNNVCVRAVGQGVYLEDGTNITGNQFMRNHIAGTMAASTTYSYPRQNNSLYWDGDNLQNAHNQSGAVTGATNASPIVVTTSSPVPSNGTQVTISGVQGNTAANATWTVANANSTLGTFALSGSTGNGNFSTPTWATNGLNAITGLVQDSTTKLITVKTQSTPVAGAQVTISGTGTPADGTWTIANVMPAPPAFELVGSQSIAASTYTSYSCCNGTWTASGSILNASNASPIVITSTSSLNTGAKVTIAGVSGNTAANNTTSNPAWTVINIDATHFSLQGSTGNGAYAGAAWSTAGASPTWYTVNGILDTSFSNANAQGSAPGAPDLYHPGGFWVTNLGNTFVNNSVAGCQAMGRGYWLLAQDQSQLYAYPEFSGNRAHGCYNGLDTQPDAINNIFDPKPTMNGTANDQAPVLLLNDNTVTRSRNRAFWGRGIFFTLHNNRFATNPYGFSLLGGGGPEGNLPGFWGMAHENVIAGMTRNNVERYPGCANTGVNFVQECTDVTLSPQASWGNYPTPSRGLGMNVQGYSYYDGPARIEHNRFVNFRFDPTGIHPNQPAARLVTRTDSALMATNLNGQLQGTPQFSGQPTSLYNGYAGDPATGWIQSNAQSVPPTQYIQNSVWDNVDFKHQVYTEAVNLGVFNDGDKTTVILDKDSQLTGLRVVDGSGTPAHDFVPVSLNSVDYYATDFTVDEPHARGPNDFRATSLMSPHKYATLNVESVTSPAGGVNPTTFRVLIQRDMPAYADTVYPNLFLNGRGQNPIYEPFVMDRMGYTVYGLTGTEHEPSTQAPAQFMPQLLFSYTDPGIKKTGDYFVNRIAVYQPVTTPANIKVYRIRRQWGQQYTGGIWPPGYNPPGNATTCDGVFFANQANAATRWQDCLNRANNVSPYTGGMTLPAASSWQSFDQSYKDLMSGTTTVAQFITNQTFFYDTATNMLYFYMIEDAPVQRGYAPYGTCNAGKYKNYVAQIQGIKSFSDPNSVQAALDASCLVSGGTPQQIDLFTCGENGCAAYLVDLSTASVGTPAACSPCVPAHPISRTDYKAWNQYHLVYGTSAQQPNGLPVVANSAIGNTLPPTDGAALTGAMTPADGTPPPSGDQVTYTFLTLSGAYVPVTENFRYRCLTMPPWAPVNARGTYPPTGGFTYPLAASVCGNP